MLGKKQALLCITLLFVIFRVNYVFAQDSLGISGEVIYDRWYRVELQGEVAGRSHTVQSREGDEIVTGTDLVVRIARGGDVMEIEMRSRFVETVEGEPLSMWSMQKLADEPIETTYKFGDDRLLIETKQGAQVTKREMDLPRGNWFTPREAEEFTRKRLRTGVRRIVITTVDPLQGPESFRLERVIIARDVEVEVTGKTFSLIRSEVTLSNSPGVVSTEYINDEGVLIKGMTSAGSLKFSFVLTDKKGAVLDKITAPEIMVSTFVKPVGVIVHPRNVSKMVVDLSVDSGDIAPLPVTGVQRVMNIAGDDGSKVRVTVTTTADRFLPNEGEGGNDKNVEPIYLASSVYLDYKSELIQKMVRRAVFSAGKGSSAAARAESMRKYVNRYINTKGLGRGFATATEVAGSRSGDCTEHGVLLAALMRADGIPSRVVSGLLYVEEFGGEKDIFGYHLWTQGYIDGVWVDYDATLGQSHFDATHIAVQTSALEDGSVMKDFSALVPLMGRLKIEIVEVEHVK